MVDTTHRSEKSAAAGTGTDEEHAGGVPEWLRPHGLHGIPVRRWRYASAVQAARAINAVAR